MVLNVESLSLELIKVVNSIMNPFTPAIQRAEAHKMLEEFKDTSPACAECGFYLSSKNNDSIIRHFGLRLIDHYVKFRWNIIGCDEKVQIKDRVLQILATGTESIIKEELHVKDALSRIVVELIKREWPQQWPSLFEELHNLCVMGDVQTELVLRIFCRLAEDIVHFQNIPDKRRREVYRTLCAHLKDLFAFFLKTLSDSCSKYFANKLSGTQTEEAISACQVAKITLETLSVFVEWVPVTHITEGTVILKQLCELLQDEELKTYAAKCLLCIVERKGKPEDRLPLLCLFEETALFKAANMCHSSDVTTSFQHYSFLKVLCQVLVTLGTNLCFAMGHFTDVKEPNNFSIYLDCMMLFTKHQSVGLSHMAQSAWLNILRDNQLSQSSSVQLLLPVLLKCDAGKLVKIGYPSKTDSVSSSYSLMEFDSDEDFEASFYKFRADACDVLRLITKLQPKMAFSYGSSFLKLVLSGYDCIAFLEIQTSSLTRFDIWDSVVHYMDVVCCTLMKNIHTDDVKDLVAEGLELLHLTLNFISEDPNVLSSALSCSSALFFFVTFSSDYVHPVLAKIFSNLMCSSSDEDQSYSKEVLNLRRHTSSLLIKLCSSYPKVFMPAFDHLCHRVKEIAEMPGHLSQLEKSALLEALMILSNELCDYEKQLSFLKEMLTPISLIWQSDAVKIGLSSPENFISFIGLDKSVEGWNEKGVHYKNRSEIMLCINVIKACAKRCKLTCDHQTAEKGNFFHPLSNELNCTFYQNPSSQFIIPALERVFLLIRAINSLHDPVIQTKIHPSFSGVMDISDSEKSSILGTTYTDCSHQPKMPLERMKIFLQSLYDGCLHVLGDSTENLSIDFYIMPALSKLITCHLCYGFLYVSDFKLRIIIRIFLKPFFLRCPTSAYIHLEDALIGFCPFMFQRLSTKWKDFRQRYGSSVGYEDQMAEMQEILEDQLNRYLSREYILFFGTLLQSKSASFDANEMQMEEDHKIIPSVNQPKSLSELGLKLFQIEGVRSVIVCTLFDALHWLDTVTNANCIPLCDLVFKHLLQNNIVKQAHEANFLLESVLRGLQELGEHECNQGLMLSLAISIYENLRPLFPELREALMSSAECDHQLMEKLEGILSQNGAKKAAHEKQKKEIFKKVVEKIIGRNIGQHHKRDIVIKNLPPLFFLPRKKNNDLTDTADDDVGLCNLFSSCEGKA